MKTRFLIPFLAAVLAGGCAREESAETAPETVVRIIVPGMSCNSCVGTLRSAFRKLDGYETDRFNLETKEVEVRGGAELNEEAVVKAARDAGFEPAAP